MAIKRRYRCRYCGFAFPAALPVTQKPSGTMLLNHLSAMHPDQVGPYLARMAAGEEIATVAAEAFDMIEEAPGGGAADGKL